MKGVFRSLPAYLVKLHKEKTNKDLHTSGLRKKIPKKKRLITSFAPVLRFIDKRTKK